MNKMIEPNKADKPAHGTGEWAAHNVNFQSGCRNRCSYCYASAMAIRFGRKTTESWGIPEIDPEKVNRKYGKMSGRIMMPTSHDLDETNIEAYLTVLKKLLVAGNDVLVVSKPRLECIRRLCKELTANKTQITFRFTIGSADDTVLKAWEPGAPSFKERLACLKHAFEKGYATSVSCEPMLDGDIHAVIRKAKPYVTDSIWLGVANRLRGTIAINRPGDADMLAMANRLIGIMTDEFITGLYDRYHNDTVIKWKESIKKIVGLERPTVKGLDV